MREISLITGQLHRAIYNLNEEARRAANQKFESGLLSAPERSLKKAFDQFRESLSQGDLQVRRRTASLLVTLVRSFEAISPKLQPEILQMIDTGLRDESPLVREATVESYSMLLEKIEPDSLNAFEQESEDATDNPPVDALRRILNIAISDPEEIVREAAAVAVAVQKCETVQQAGVRFLLQHVDDRRYRRACRSIESLAEFASQQSMYLPELKDSLNAGDWRFRLAALKATLRLAKLGKLPQLLLANVVRRLFDAEKKVASVAQEVIQTSINLIERDDATVGEFLTECLWLSHQFDPRQHLPAILETQIVQSHDVEILKACRDRLTWHRKNGTQEQSLEADSTSGESDLVIEAGDLASLNGNSAIGWIAGTILRSG